MNASRKCLLVYLLALEVAAVIFFLYGFFPLKSYSGRNASFDELPKAVALKNVNPREIYHKHVDKLVIMVIDALRYDFVVGDGADKNMPYLSSMINRHDSCLLKTKVEAPTVTMPRIKAFMSGNLPAYIDVIRNFENAKVVDDNLLWQASKHGLNLIFYGDETWLNLFPNVFKRSETTTSFFVKDFYEVDHNVTRNLPNELNSTDWDMMVLHYLGLDHIGHVEGPKSHLVPPKLLEMDSVISKIDRHFKNLKQNKGERVVLVICGDHGMKDTGGHGGTSLAEIYIPFITLNYGCNTSTRFDKIDQIDLTPFLSVLLGLPIPADSVGTLSIKVLESLDKYSALYALHYNTARLFQIFQNYNTDHDYSIDILNNMRDAQEAFENWVKTNSTQEFHSASDLYFHLQNIMSYRIIKQSVRFDACIIAVSIIMLMQIFVILFLPCDPQLSFRETILSVILCLSFFGGSHVICQSPGVSTVLCEYTAFSELALIFFAASFSYNFTLMTKIYKQKNKIFLGCDNWLLGLLVVHLVSYGSSSYIEEEHQYWYFMLATIGLLSFPKRPFIVTVVLISHRLLRHLNQTGDKWAALPDIGDWLREDINTQYLAVTYIFSIYIIVHWCYTNLMNRNATSKVFILLVKALFFTQILVLSTYKMAVGELKLPGILYPQSRGAFESSLFWWFTILQIILYGFSFTYLRGIFPSRNFPSSKVKFMYYNIDFLLVILLPVMILLSKIHNIILIPCLLYSTEILTIFGRSSNIYNLIFFYRGLGNVFFFYQGNSNSLATIDVSAGFIGLQEFHLFLSSFFVFLNTFQSHILSNLLLLRTIFSDRRYYFEEHSYYRITTWLCCVYLLSFTMWITVLRNHLMVWSVFSPKLLYLSCELCVYAFIILLSIFLELVHFFISFLTRKVPKLTV